MTFDLLLLLVRRGVIQVWLSTEGRLCWRSKARTDEQAQAVKVHSKQLQLLLSHSDTRLCIDVKAHSMDFRPTGNWFRCKICELGRSELAEHMQRVKEAKEASV